jgi:hypothetical protein
MGKWSTVGLRTTVAWWKRLLFGSLALLFTLLLTIALIAIKDFRREPNLQWLNGGEIQMVGYVLIFGGLAILVTYICFVVPLVLLWPVESQRKHWYAMLCVSMLWPPLLVGVAEWPSPSGFFGDLRADRSLYAWLELFALCWCGCYLLLIYRYHRRAKDPPG